MQMQDVPQEPRYSPHTLTRDGAYGSAHVLYSVTNVSTFKVTLRLIKLFLLNTQVLLHHHTEEPIIFYCAVM